MSDKTQLLGDYHTRELAMKRKKQAFLTRVVLPTIALSTYSAAGILHDVIPFPGRAIFGSEQVKNERIQQYRISGSNSDSNLPTLNRDVELATDKQANFARELAGSDGIIDKNERDSACIQASTNQAQIDAINEVLIKVKQRKVKGIRLSSQRLNGCSQEVQE